LPIASKQHYLDILQEVLGYPEVARHPVIGDSVRRLQRKVAAAVMLFAKQAAEQSKERLLLLQQQQQQ